MSTDQYTVTSNVLRAELRLTLDDGDPWGSAMGWAFALGECLAVMRYDYDEDFPARPPHFGAGALLRSPQRCSRVWDMQINVVRRSALAQLAVLTMAAPIWMLWWMLKIVFLGLVVLGKVLAVIFGGVYDHIAARRAGTTVAELNDAADQAAKHRQAAVSNRR
jgi:hypothetical protein